MPLDANSGELKITVAYWYLPSGKRVARLKDAKEWGVEPDINLPMNDDAQARLMMEEARSESKRTAHPVTAPATAPTTQPLDPQFDAALDAVRKKLN